MIMLAKVVPYGGNAVMYALEKEKAKLERLMVQFVISPSKEEAANFTMKEWADLQDESLETMDSIEIIPEGMKKEVKTNFRNSMNVGGLPSDSKSGTLHLHMDCCRVDLDGNTNDVHDIHKRAMMAAEIINMRHGWKQPKEIRNMRKEEIADFCEYTLRNMQEFDVDFYFKMLRMKGYEVTPRYDKSKNVFVKPEGQSACILPWRENEGIYAKLVGYTIGKNASVFKASEIGRRFMVSQLEVTWKKLHPKPSQVRMTPAAPAVTPSSRPSRPTTQTTVSSQPKVQPRAQQKPMPFFTTFNIDTPIGSKVVEIPNSVKDIFLNEAQVPEGNDAATVENVAHAAMLLFAGYIDAATSMSESCGGGRGSAPESGWGKKDDEDNRVYARRCLQMAHSMYKPKSVKRGFHR